MKIKTIKEKPLYAVSAGISIFLLFFILSCSWIGDEVKNQGQEAKREYGLKETIIVSQQADPYYSLAQKIAQTERLEIVEEFTEVLKFHPKFIIWVASPQNLTKERLLNIGRIFKSSDYYPGLGIISGSTLEKAEQLWARRNLAQEGSSYVGGDVEETQLIYEPTIFNISDGSQGKIELNKDNLIKVLKQADYLYWARHVGGTTWYWNAESKYFGENDELYAKDIPELRPVVIYTPSCSSFRPWLKNSIALGFVDNGAVAYIGNANSPFHTNALLKHGLSVPGISSWKEFPLGLVAQVESKAAIRAYFSVPQFFMLGDPRIYFSREQPYRIISDTINENGKRVIEGESSENGILAVKIENGAGFDFLAIKGVTSVSANDLFHNNQLQTLNLGVDKYVLLLHNGGHFEIELSKKAPFLWGFTDALTDAFDYAWVVMWLDVKVINGPFIYSVSLPIFAAILLFKIFRRKKSVKDYPKIFLMTFLLALLRVAYFWLRWDDYSISANLVNPTAFQIALGGMGVFACTTGGLMLMKDTKKIVVKMLGLVFTVLPQFLLTVFFLVFITFMNTATQINGLTSMWLCNYYIFWLSFIGLLLEISIILVVYRIVISGKKS